MFPIAPFELFISIYKIQLNLFKITVLYNFFYIIIIIKKGWQRKAVRERLTPYQSEDSSPTIPTHRMKEEKGKTAGDKK